MVGHVNPIQSKRCCIHCVGVSTHVRHPIAMEYMLHSMMLHNHHVDATMVASDEAGQTQPYFPCERGARPSQPWPTMRISMRLIRVMVKIHHRADVTLGSFV